MNMNEVISNLKQEAAKTPAFKAVCTDFALRQRSRSFLTLFAMSKRMREEGFQFSDEDYAAVLRRLSQLGFGDIQKDKKGRVKALTDIRIKLDSIGSVALGETDNLKSFRRRNRKFYASVQTNKAPVSKAPAVAMKTQVKPAASTQPSTAPASKQPPLNSFSVSLTVSLNGKPIVVQVPKGLTAHEIAAIVSGLNQVNLAA